MHRPNWYPDWTGETCVIVAGGPSVKSIDLTLAKGVTRFIAINNSWVLAPWADVLYACDAPWWRKHDGNLTNWRNFQGLKVTQDELARQEFGINRVICERHHENLVLDRPGQIGWGGQRGISLHQSQFAVVG